MTPKGKDRPNSSKDCNQSPDKKKEQDGGQKSAKETSESDEVLKPSKMAGDLGKKIEGVLRKLEKLDTIESCQNKMYTTLSSIEESVSPLNSDVKKLKVETRKLKSKKVWISGFSYLTLNDIQRASKTMFVELKN